MSTDLTRRKLCKTASAALVLTPMIFLARHASATVNAATRAALMYQNMPKDGMSCSTCVDFIPGKTAKALGGCTKIPEDDEISPDAYCDKWNTM